MLNEKQQKKIENFIQKQEDKKLKIKMQKRKKEEKRLLKKDEIITAINDEKVFTIAALRYKLYKYKIGDSITIEYLRDGRTYTTKLKLTS